jgi:hypothetical protein
MKARWMFWGGKMVVIMVAVAALGAAVVMLLWNAVVPATFNGPTLGYTQALGLLILSRLLFGGWGRHGGGLKQVHWRRRMEHHFASLPPEEREKMKREWESACGHDFGHGPAAEQKAD